MPTLTISEAPLLIELTYNSNERPTELHVNNQTDHDAYVEIVQSRDIGTAPAGRKVGAIFRGGTDTSIPIETGANVRLQGEIDARGRLDGFDFQTAWPYAG